MKGTSHTKVSKTLAFVSIIEAVYIVWMFNYFKTEINVNGFLERDTQTFFRKELSKKISNFLAHDVARSDEKIEGTDGVFAKNGLFSIVREDKSSKICPLGNVVGWLYGLFLLGRLYFYRQDGQWIKTAKYTSLVLAVIIIVGSLISNLNAFLYFLPVLVCEILLFNSTRCMEA